MIPVFDYRPAYELHKAELEDAIRRVLSSGQLVLGPEVRAFEEEFSHYVGVAGAVGVNSGTDALILALRVLGVGPGDEVLTVANAGVPPVAAIRAVGAVPRFVDVAPDSLLMDPDRLADAVSERTRCILPVHLYGRPAAMDAIVDFARARDLCVVEDCAQAHGARLGGTHVGGFGQVGCFSFYPTKNLGAYGDGGMCVTADPILEEKLRAQRMYGFAGDRHAHIEGLNSRLDELQAALLRVHLRHLDAALEARREIAHQYSCGLAGVRCQLPESPPGSAHAYHLYVLQTRERQRACEALGEAGVGYGIHYPEPVHLMEAYAPLGYRLGDLPVSEQASKAVLSLPLYPGLDVGSVKRVIEVLDDALREGG